MAANIRELAAHLHAIRGNEPTTPSQITALETHALAMDLVALPVLAIGTVPCS
jgi:hypothetical protein